ncbi:CheY-specific phosphatase CheX [Silvibacterium bohemicum]|uniref:CheY-specific phosphatase CheX n=1 Tax=Silvibacterium bohemicum TaxID=1577686 RepID=A0A841K1V6_9BACT|nr:chemotaxis protein CheX [Silvibacterium bohemicum]MBB6146577.1 CheY-specific phosphatase CheX [Silvibacterium bohemicum]
MSVQEIDIFGIKKLAAETVSGLIPHAFLTMANVEAVVGEDKRDERKDAARSAGRSVAGVIGWVGALSGTGILECSPEFACTLANLMLGTEATTLTEDALDAVAEMTNIVFGGMKTQLEKHFGAMALSIPTIIYGTDVEMRTSGELITVLPIEIGDQLLRVKLYMNSLEEKRGALGQFWTISCAGR